MTKQEEIREGIAELCHIMRTEGKLRRFPPESDADDILQYLHSQGVVIKVDREYLEGQMDVEYLYGEYIPGYGYQQVARDKEGLEKAGYVAVEPLIEV